MPVDDLEMVALFASSPVRSALRASYVMRAASAFFNLDITQFGTNPANTLAYQSLRALEAQALVELAELLRDEHNIHPVARTIRGRDQLLLHRDMIGHPMTVRWRRADRQQFADDGHQWSPVRSGLIWDVQKAINEQLAAQGAAVRLDDVPVDFEMAETLNFILARSAQPNVGVHSSEALHTYLQAQKPAFMRVLEAHPNGVAEE